MSHTEKMTFAVAGNICMGTRCSKAGAARRCWLQGWGKVSHSVSCSTGALCNHQTFPRCKYT